MDSGLVDERSSTISDPKNLCCVENVQLRRAIVLSPIASITRILH